METYKKGENIYGAEQMEEDKDGVKYKVTKKSVAVPPPAAKLPMQHVLPPTGGQCPSDHQGPATTTTANDDADAENSKKNVFLYEKQKLKIEQEKKITNGTSCVCCCS